MWSLSRNSSAVLGNLQFASPDFAVGRKGKDLLRCFKVRIHAVESNKSRPRPSISA